MVPRTDMKNVPARKRAAEGGDPLGVDPRKAAGECDRSVVILALLADFEQLPRLASTVPEVAVVERHRCDARLGEPIGVGIKSHLAGAGEAVGQHDQRKWPVAVWPMQRRHTAETSRRKLYVATGSRQCAFLSIYDDALTATTIL